LGCARRGGLRAAPVGGRTPVTLLHFPCPARLPCARYSTRFGTTPAADFGDALAAVTDRSLLVNDADTSRPTAEGFYLNNEIGLALVG